MQPLKLKFKKLHKKIGTELISNTQTVDHVLFIYHTYVNVEKKKK